MGNAIGTQVREEVEADLLAKLREFSGQEGEGVNESELRKVLPGYLKGGPCKESYTAWQECTETNIDDRKCQDLSWRLDSCMFSHTDYYPMPTTECYQEKWCKAAKAFFKLG